MGTVGLNFGSATSGQGFDVAQAVTQIQASEQAIETPWQNQLTALKAQDTVFSSLGTDLSSLTTSLQSLTSFDGVLSAKQGSSSDTNIVSLTSAAATAQAGSHTITVSQLAQTSSDVSTVITNSNDTLSGTLTIQGHTFNVDSADNDTSIASLSAAINSAGIGVSSSVITDSSGSRLSIVSGTSGAAGQLTISSSLSGVSSGAITFQTGQTGQDANLTVDGVSITSPSNTVSGAIAGVTFQLLASSSTPTPVQVQITNDTTAVGSALSSFVSAYNAVVKDVNTQEGNDSTGKPEPLYGSPTIATIQSDLTTALFSGTASGSISNITQLGLTVNNDGTLALNSDTLDSVLNSNYSDVTGFLQNAGSFGQTLSSALSSVGTQAPNGAIYLAQQQNATEEASLNLDITNENGTLATQKTTLTNELNTANQILQSIPSQLNEVNQIYSAFTGYNTVPGG